MDRKPVKAINTITTLDKNLSNRDDLMQLIDEILVSNDITGIEKSDLEFSRYRIYES
ncbi:MAG: hypothetical protein GWO08_18485, partial [Gammaproteobacteria bacterium]|nr:hypothetical protein [Gammaproteobacteria bacterium]NIR63377.1 hypothetical protein [candidate division Zixibacteria bacterium]NIR95550.1 hypothetical protein [Gammaproteobacteria bacterium]NIU13493.1 hypothetical protein [candidate division Zixibacteria bacterium]NIV05528.1 hypothetical protein [candidate division Zixibacteria bacterium]